MSEVDSGHPTQSSELIFLTTHCFLFSFSFFPEYLLYLACSCLVFVDVFTVD